jgi:hypothetical protein
MLARIAPNAPVMMPTADEIFGRQLAPVPWRSSSLVLALAVELLPTIEDDLTADLVEQLVLALVDKDEELAAVRSVISAALEQSHGQHTEIVRLRRRLADSLNANRRDRISHE